MMFKTMAVKDKKALKKQLITTNVKFKPSALAIFFFFKSAFSFYNTERISLLSRFHLFLNETDLQLPPLNGALYTVLSFSSCTFEELCKCFLFCTRLMLEITLCETY